MRNRMELYQAVKYEVNNFQADHGMSLPELWAVVNHRMIGNEAIDYISINLSDWWKATCLEDYEESKIMDYTSFYAKISL